jgi:hypothetical protein
MEHKLPILFTKAFHHLWYNASVMNGAQASGSLHQDLIQIFILPTWSSYEFTSKDHIQLVNSLYLKLFVTTKLFLDDLSCSLMFRVAHQCFELFIDV